MRGHTKRNNSKFKKSVKTKKSHHKSAKTKKSKRVKKSHAGMPRHKPRNKNKRGGGIGYGFDLNDQIGGLPLVNGESTCDTV
jgi:hypothetical protein